MSKIFLKNLKTEGMTQTVKSSKFQLDSNSKAAPFEDRNQIFHDVYEVSKNLIYLFYPVRFNWNIFTSVRADARHIFPDCSPQPDGRGGAASLGAGGGGWAAGAAVDAGDPERDGGAAQEALLHASEGRHTLAHGIHLQLGE